MSGPKCTFERDARDAPPVSIGADFIPVYVPDLTGNERKYLVECVDTGWISRGPFVDSFERSFEKEVGTASALAVANGSVALHLALLGIFGFDNLRPEDEILVPTFTYVATVNAIRLAGARPRFVDSDPHTWVIDVADAERRVGPRTRGLIAVHLYAAMCDMPSVLKLAREKRLSVIEDAAEAFGVALSGKKAGTFGDVGTFSFFGNKTITTGEGGMVVTDDPVLRDRMMQLRSQGVPLRPTSIEERYWHDVFGLNYRMSNTTAALGVAQMERAAELIARKKAIAKTYRTELADLPLSFQNVPSDVESPEWLVSFLVPQRLDRAKMMAQMLERHKVETRPTFACAHHLPMYRTEERFPVAEDLARRGISLPSWPGLDDEKLGRVIDAVRDTFKSAAMSNS